MRYCTFIFSMSCSIASVTSYLSGIEAKKSYKMATSILLKFLTLKWNISRTIWRLEVGDGSFSCIFHALSFKLNVFFDRRFPLIPFHMYLQCLSTLILDTRQIKCDKTTKIFSLNKVLFYIFVSFSLQITLDLLYI